MPSLGIRYDSGNTCQSLTSTGTPNYTHLVSAFGFSRSSGQDLYDGMGAQFGYRDENSSFIYLLGHRYYDAQFGQFMTRDPMGYGGGVNLYGYVGNNPVNESDPDGTQAQVVPVVLVGGAVLTAWLYWYYSHKGMLPIINISPPWSNPTTVFPGTTPNHPPVVMPTTRPVNDPTELGLPTCGDYPFNPPRKWKPGQGLQTDENGNPIDKNGGVWQKGPNHNFPGEGREWDVQTGGGHINVGGDTGTAKYPVKRGRR